MKKSQQISERLQRIGGGCDAAEVMRCTGTSKAAVALALRYSLLLLLGLYKSNGRNYQNNRCNRSKRLKLLVNSTKILCFH